MRDAACDKQSTVPLPETDRVRLAGLVAAVGEKTASRRVRLSRHAVARAVAGFPVHAGTREMVRSWIEAADAEEHAAPDGRRP